MIRANVKEDDEQTMAHFLNGLNDVGRNPRLRFFTFGEDPYEEHEEHVDGDEGNHGETQEKTLNQHEYDHTCARSNKG